MTPSTFVRMLSGMSRVTRTLLTIIATRPALLVTLTLPEHLDEGHVRFARDLATAARRYAIEVERSWRGLPALTAVGEVAART